MQWPLLKKIAFRFLFAYLILYGAPLPPTWPPWTQIVPWAGRLLFGVNVSFRFTGSGDTTYHYVQALCFALTAVVAALLWSLVDYKSAHYHRLYLALRVFVRLSLGMTMIGYGAAKVIPSQFVAPSLERLLEPFGEASPMGLLWTFMGLSAPYTIFTGAAEMLSGILLFFPRTATLGALIGVGVISHVVALNFCYDVPVKLYSLHLLAMAIFVAAPDAKRLANLFLLNRVAEPASMETVLQGPVWRRAAFALKMLLLVTVTATSLYNSYSMRESLSGDSPLYGIWEVQQFAQDGESRPPLLTDTERWRRLIVGRSGKFAFVEQMNGRRSGGSLRVEASEKKLFLQDQELIYSRPTPDTLLLEGKYEGRAIRARMHLLKEDQFRLINRPFHWITEIPFNR